MKTRLIRMLTFAFNFVENTPIDAMATAKSTDFIVIIIEQKNHLDVGKMSVNTLTITLSSLQPDILSFTQMWFLLVQIFFHCWEI